MRSKFIKRHGHTFYIGIHEDIEPIESNVQCRVEMQTDGDSDVRHIWLTGTHYAFSRTATEVSVFDDIGQAMTECINYLVAQNTWRVADGERRKAIQFLEIAWATPDEERRQLKGREMIEFFDELTASDTVGSQE